MTPQDTYLALLVVQALHLPHHRIVKRHISFAEVVSAFVLCVPPWAPLPAFVLVGCASDSDSGANNRKCLD